MNTNNIILTNLEVIAQLANRAGITDWKEYDQYAETLKRELGKRNLIDDSKAGMKMQDALAKTSVFAIFEALQGSGIECPTFDDYDDLMMIYIAQRSYDL